MIPALCTCQRGEFLSPACMCTACMGIGPTISVLSPCEEAVETLAKVQAEVQMFTSKVAVTTVSGSVPSVAVSTPTETPMEQDKAPVIKVWPLQPWTLMTFMKEEVRSA